MIKRFDKKAQSIFGLSFGVIFSIILVIAIIGIAIYVIVYFLNLGSCSEIGLFYENLQDEVDNAWTSGIYSGYFGNNSKLPSKIEYVCFGNLTISSIDSNSAELHQAIEDSNLGSEESNVFLHPSNKACEGGLSYNYIKHAEIKQFFCKKVENGKINVKLSKQTGSSLVSLTRS